MEKSDRSKPEQTVQEGLNVQDLEVSQAQEVVSEGLQSDLQFQKSVDPAESEASKLGVMPETQCLVQKEELAQKVQTQDSLQKTEENETSLPAFKKIAKDEKLKQNTDANIMAQQKDERSFVLEHDSRQTNQPEADAMHQDSDLLAEDKLSDKNSESDRNTTLQQTSETLKSVLRVPEKESIQTQQEDNNSTHQEFDRNEEYESSKIELEKNLSAQLIDETLEESIIDLIEELTQIAEQQTNDMVRQECDRTTENGRLFQESESGPESEESRLECSQTRQLEEEEDASLQLPSRICHHRTHIMQRPRLPPVPEEPDDPLTPFEVEIPVRRNRRTLGVRLPTVLPTGMSDYMQRVRERHIPPERRAFYEELQSRCVKLFCSLLIGGLLVVVLYFLIDFLERKYGNNESRVSSPMDDFRLHFNFSTSAFNPGLSEADLDISITTPVADLDFDIISSMADMDTKVTPVPNGVNFNGTNPVIDVE